MPENNDNNSMFNQDSSMFSAFGGGDIQDPLDAELDALLGLGQEQTPPDEPVVEKVVEQTNEVVEEIIEEPMLEPIEEIKEAPVEAVDENKADETFEPTPEGNALLEDILKTAAIEQLEQEKLAQENIEETSQEFFEEEFIEEIKETIQEEKAPQKELPTVQKACDLENMDVVTVAPVEFASFDDIETTFSENAKQNLDILQDVKMRVTVELGRARCSVRKILDFQKGSIVELYKVAGEPVELFANGKLVGYGEVIVMEDKFGLRVTSINQPTNQD